MLIAKNLRSEKMQLIGNNRIGSLGKIRTSNPSVNSERGGKSKCRVWCRLQEKRSHFSCFSCTQCCTQSCRVGIQNCDAIRRESFENIIKSVGIKYHSNVKSHVVSESVGFANPTGSPEDYNCVRSKCF